MAAIRKNDVAGMTYLCNPTDNPAWLRQGRYYRRAEPYR
jgi:hypothetical protein